MFVKCNVAAFACHALGFSVQQQIYDVNTLLVSLASSLKRLLPVQQASHYTHAFVGSLVDCRSD